MSFIKRILLALMVLVGLLIFISDTSELETHTDVFCAYGKVFVRFKEGNKIWGTILLDDSGVPISCQEGHVPSIKSLNKGTII